MVGVQPAVVGMASGSGGAEGDLCVGHNLGCFRHVRDDVGYLLLDLW